MRGHIGLYIIKDGEDVSGGPLSEFVKQVEAAAAANPKQTRPEFRKGTNVVLNMRDGSIIHDKFDEKKSGGVILNRVGRVRLTDVRSISIERKKET